MSFRYCPKCNSELTSNDHYFCSSCGFVLPDSLKNSEIPIRSKVIKPEYLSNKLYIKLQKIKTFSEKYILTKGNIKYYLLALVLFFLGAFLGNIGTFVYEKITVNYGEKPPSTVNQTTSSAKVSKNVLESKLDFGSSTVYPNRMSDFVPSNADLYVLVPDSKSFINLAAEELSADSKTISAYTTLLNGPIAVVSIKINDKTEWALITLVNQKELVSAIIKEKYIEGLKLSLINDVLILSSGDEVLKMTEDAINNYSLNLSLSPAYVNAKSRLPSEGKILIIAFNENGTNALMNLKGSIKDEKVANALEQVVVSGYNEVVIQ